MEGPQMAPVACSRSSTKEIRNTAVRGLSEVTAGAQPRVITTLISSGDSAQHASFVTEEIQMATAVIFLSYMVVKCTRPAPLKMQPSHGVPLRTTMMWTNSGDIVEVRNVVFVINIYISYCKNLPFRTGKTS